MHSKYSADSAFRSVERFNFLLGQNWMFLLLALLKTLEPGNSSKIKWRKGLFQLYT